jgi:hypothetical protein
MRKVLPLTSPTLQKPRKGAHNASNGHPGSGSPVCPRCLGVEPGKPGGTPEVCHPGPFTEQLCGECERVTRALKTAEGLHVWEPRGGCNDACVVCGVVVRGLNYPLTPCPGAKPQTGLRSWRDLVWQPPPEKLLRRNVQLWAWLLAPDSYFLLRPALGIDGKSTRKAVVGQTPRAWEGMYRGQGPTNCKDPLYYGEDMLTTPMDLYWLEGDVQQAIVPNACVLRYVTEAALSESFLKAPLPDSAWDFTKEHPDRPGVTLDAYTLADILCGKKDPWEDAVFDFPE